MLKHTFEDVWYILPMLYISYVLIELFERRKIDDNKLILYLQKYGPLVGTLTGLIPQCGFSVLAAMLFLNKQITLGTLLSVFIATSDETIPILLAQPTMYSSLWAMIGIKIVVGITVGYFADMLFKQKWVSFHEMEEVGCSCCYVQYPMYLSAMLRTVKIFAFLFGITYFINVLMHDIAVEWLGQLLGNQFLQVILASLVGCIPNCVSSVVLTQLFVLEQISFSALMSGLITNAGLGMVVLVRYGDCKKEVFKIMGILLIVAWSVGYIL